jgi:hypothetical protein
MEPSAAISRPTLAIDRKKPRLFLLAPVLCLLLWQATTIYAQTPVNAGGSAESFAQLVTLSIVPPAGGTSITASAVMSIDNSLSCDSPNSGNAQGFPFPVFVAQNVPIDPNSLPGQITYFNSYFYYFGINQHYLELATLNVSCSIASSGGSSSSYNFSIPIYFCDTNTLSSPQPAIGLSTSGCKNTSVPSTCPFSPAGIRAPNTYFRNSATENLQVYEPMSGGSQPPAQTPAVAVDVQLLYNGFSVADRSGFSPFLVRVACSALSSFTND